MEQDKQAALEAAGFFAGSIKEFLGLSEEETEDIEIKLALEDKLTQAAQAATAITDSKEEAN